MLVGGVGVVVVVVGVVVDTRIGCVVFLIFF